MTHRTHSARFFRNHKARREKVLRKMSNMRAAKERKRLSNPPEQEPKMERFNRFEFGVRDRLTGEAAWTELKSVRHAAKSLGLILKFS